MAFKENQETVTFEAGSDLSSSQFHFVSLAADGQVDATGDGAHADGVLQNDPSAQGRAAEVAISGKVQVKCGGNTTTGGPVASDSSGKAVDATSGDVILGTFVTSGANDEIVTMLFEPRGAA
jgi:hypothetical protein